MIRMRSFVAEERGTASIEFLFVVPIITMIFFASFESSLFMIRNVMLDRSVDIVVREVRLGTLAIDPNDLSASAEILKEEICATSSLNGDLQECIDSMMVWMQPINTATFDMPTVPVNCVDKTTDPASRPPPTPGDFEFGTDNDIVLMRICLKQEPMLPTTIVGAGLIEGEADGNYALTTTTTFVIEPG